MQILFGGDKLNYKKRGFSLYDVEDYLRVAGAEKINEGAVSTLEEEMESLTDKLLNKSTIFANYAGRSKLIKCSDIKFAVESINSDKTVYIRKKLKHKKLKLHRKKYHVIKNSSSNIKLTSL